MTKITYLGIDETSLGIGSDSIILVAAETENPDLCKSAGYLALKKSKDYLRAANAYIESENRDNQGIRPSKVPNLPNISEMKANGLKTFHWTRARGGRFPRQLIEHAGIAHVVATNGYNPSSTVLLIDVFYANLDKSRFLIKEYLHARGFKIPSQNIELWGSGDKTIPIINYADLLAFQVGLYLNEKYRRCFPERLKFPLKPSEIPYDEQRVMVPLESNSRDILEKLVSSWK